jgi:FlaA1/EpsC-like NDP-sugar epimerase
LSQALIQAAIGLPRLSKRALVLVVDTSLCVLSVWLAFYLRLGEWVSLLQPEKWQLWLAAVLSVVIALPIFVIHGFYRAIFRYSGWASLMTVAKAMLVYGVLFMTVITVMGFSGIPRTIGIIQPILLLMLVGASRALARYWLGGSYQRRLQNASLPKMLIYGAGDAGQQIAVAMSNSHEVCVVGFLDDDDRLHGHELNGQPIYAPANLAHLVKALGVSHVLLALPSISRQRRYQILNQLTPYKVQVRTLPDLNDLAHGRVSVSDIKDLDIDDLLSREPVQPNSLLLNANTQGKTVLVTGAGGSIGSELCRQILRTSPTQLLLVEMSEFTLYQIHQELQADPLSAHVELVPLLASVCDQVRMQEIMSTWKPHSVYHAAAYKHVPLVEHNPAEGLRNNVWGTRVCAEAALSNSVRNFLLVSTDKAVRPTNIMGATKRLAEMVLQALAEQNGKTTFSTVRFGNVLGSSGSVVPLFREQIKNGGPITLTHFDITRYFMTIQEAAQLVIQAGAMGQGGDVFVLDMGQPVKIIDLARRMVELSGLTLRDELHPDGDIEINVTGLRPGEKLYEELLIGDNPELTQHPRIAMAREQFMSWPALEQKLNALRIAMSANDVPVIRAMLKDLISGYQPTGEVVDWVHLALQREALANE